MSFHTFCKAEPTFRESQTNWEKEGDLNQDNVRNLKDLKLTTKEIELYFEEDPSRPDGNCFYHSMVDYIEGNDTEIYKTIFETPAYLNEWMKEHARYQADSEVGFKEEEMFMMHWLRNLVYEESLKPTNNEKNGDATSPSIIEFRERLSKGVEQTKSDQNKYYDNDGNIEGSKSYGHVGTDLWTMDREIDLTARFLKIDICTFQRIGGKDEWIMSLYDTAKDVLDGPICFLKNNGVHFTNLKFEGKAKKNAKDAEVAKSKMDKLLKEARDRKKARKAEKARKEAEKARKEAENGNRKKNTSKRSRNTENNIGSGKEAWAELPKEKEIPNENVKELVQEVNAVDGLMGLVNQNDNEILNLIEERNNTNKEKIRKLKLAQQKLNNWDGNSDEINEIKLIISLKDIDVNQAAKDGATPLIMACRKGHMDVVRLLLARKEIQINKFKNDGATPLYVACYHGQVDVVRLLLVRKEIQINQADEKETTPINIASFNGHTNIVQLLLEQPNINIGKIDDYGDTPLISARKKGHVEIVALLEDKIKLEQQKLNNWDGNSDEINDIKSIISLGDIDVDQVNEDGNTPLSIASINGHTEIVALLNARAPVWVNNRGETELYLACWRGNVGNVKYYLENDKNIKINQATNRGTTPLRIACSKSLRIVKLLLARPEILINKANKDGETPLYITCGE